jgi:hypothetical protein
MEAVRPQTNFLAAFEESLLAALKSIEMEHCGGDMLLDVLVDQCVIQPQPGSLGDSYSPSNRME